MDDDRDELLKEKLDLMNPRRVQRDNFLDAIAQMESSGGQNFDHPVIHSGPQSGQQAIGTYGLLPNTVEELNNRARLHNTLTPEMEAAVRGPASVKDTLESNPELEKQYAQQLADKILGHVQDPDMAAYAWNSGHNLSPEKIQKRDYLSSPYVKKFQKIRIKLGEK